MIVELAESCRGGWLLLIQLEEAVLLYCATKGQVLHGGALGAEDPGSGIFRFRRHHARGGG